MQSAFLQFDPIEMCRFCFIIKNLSGTQTTGRSYRSDTDIHAIRTSAEQAVIDIKAKRKQEK